MKNIDFLPAQVRHRRTTRQDNKTRIAIAIIIGVGILIAHFPQIRTFRYLQNEMVHVEGQYQIAQQQIAEWNRLRGDLELTRAKAELWTYLRHPWPRTRILNEVIDSLPESIHLSVLGIAEEVPIPSGGLKPAPNLNLNSGQAEGTTEIKLPWPSETLKEMREEFDDRKTRVVLEGTASNPGELYVYLGALSSNPLIASAELLSLEQGEKTGQAAKFRAVLEIQPHLLQQLTQPPIKPMTPAPTQSLTITQSP